MYNIQAEMHLSEQENMPAYGTVTIEDCIRFSVIVRKYQNESGEEQTFISYPRLLKKGEWSNVLTIEPELKEEIQRTVGETLKRELTKDLYLPDIEDVEVIPVPQKIQGKAVICAIANLKICGIQIHGITIKQGERGYLVNMPQFKTASGKWKDVIYGTNAAMQQKIRETVLETYKNVLGEKGKEQA